MTGTSDSIIRLYITETNFSKLCGLSSQEVGRMIHPAVKHLRQFTRTFIGSMLAIAALSMILCLQPNSISAQQTGKQADKTKPGPVLTEDNEIKIGRENAEENDKHIRLVTDAVIVERVNRIGQELAAVANKTPIAAKWGSSQLKPFNYTFKIVDDKDVNAYSLPGGFIYVNKGLLDYVHSDDELAGVLAHEITHASHHHMVKLLHEQKKIQNVLLPAIIAAVLLTKGKGNAIGDILITSQLYTIAQLNTYGIEAEKDADHGGLILMSHTNYNPVGLYSFMLRLAADERNHLVGDLGIYRTHPPGAERVEAAHALLDELHIPIEISKVDPSQRISVVLVKGGLQGRDVAQLKIRDLILCQLVAANDLSAEERGKRVAARMNKMLDSKLQPFEVKLNSDKTKVIVRGFTVLTDDDADAQKKSLSALAHEMADTISQLNMKRQLESPD